MWGPPDQVQYAVRANAERMGINPDKVIGVWPFWEGAGNRIHNVMGPYESSTFHGASRFESNNLVLPNTTSYVQSGVYPSGGRFTIIKRFNYRSAIQGSVTGINDGSNRRLYFGLNNTSIHLAWLAFGTGNQQSNVNHNAPPETWNTWALSCFQSGADLYINSRYIDSVSGTWSGTSTSPIAFGYHVSQFAFARATFGIGVFVNEQLSADQISEFDAPYALLMPVARPVFFDMGRTSPTHTPRLVGVGSPAKKAVRPDNFTLDYSHPLAQGLVFAGMGRTMGSLDSSLARIPLTIYGSPILWTDESNRGCLDFDGASMLRGPLVVPSYPFTLSTFINYTHTNWRWALSLQNALDNYHSTVGRTTAPAGLAAFSRNNDVASSVAGLGVDRAGWVHICGVFASESSINLYVDGRYVTTTTTTIANFSRTSVAVGGLVRTGTMAYWLGSVRDPIIHNRALSPAEIALLADRTDPMLGGLVKEHWPTVYFDMGSTTGTPIPAPTGLYGIAQTQAITWYWTPGE